MPIPYKRKRQLLLEKKQQLVPALQKHISLRNVSAALKLPAPAQETLARALERGVKKQRIALDFLQGEPDADIKGLIEALDGEYQVRTPYPRVATDKGNQQEAAGEKRHTNDKDVTALTDLLLVYGLYENRLIAETVASADYMVGVLELILALDRVREPLGAETETVTLAVCAIAVRLIEQINDLLAEKYAHKVAVLQVESLAWGRFTRKPSFSPLHPHQKKCMP